MSTEETTNTEKTSKDSKATDDKKPRWMPFMKEATKYCAGIVIGAGALMVIQSFIGGSGETGEAGGNADL